MIGKIKGILVKKSDYKVCIDVGGLCYEVNTPRTVSLKLNSSPSGEVEVVIYHYFQMESNKAIPVMIGFLDELEREFFETFISVSGIGPRAAMRAFDKPISLIAGAIEEGNTDFLRSLAGIGPQKAKQIVAQLQGKVGRFALLKTTAVDVGVAHKEIIEEAKQILRRLQYNPKEADAMVKKAIEAKSDIASIEDLLNEIYRQRK